MRVSWTLNPLQRRISVYRNMLLSIGIDAQRSIGSWLTIHAEKKEADRNDAGAASEYQEWPKEDGDLRHSPRENKDTSNKAYGNSPRIPPELKPTKKIA